MRAVSDDQTRVLVGRHPGRARHRAWRGASPPARATAAGILWGVDPGRRLVAVAAADQGARDRDPRRARLASPGVLVAGIIVGVCREPRDRHPRSAGRRRHARRRRLGDHPRHPAAAAPRPVRPRTHRAGVACSTAAPASATRATSDERQLWPLPFDRWLVGRDRCCSCSPRRSCSIGSISSATCCRGSSGRRRRSGSTC